RDRGRACPLELGAKLRRVAARVDHDGLGRARRCADDVAVGADRAELVAVDRECRGGAHGRLSLRAVWEPFSSDSVASMQSWNLRQIETPGGRRSPVVLDPEESAGRAVLIGLDPGQELGEHEVKEHAFVLVVEGAVQVEAGGETTDGPAGMLLPFAPQDL